MEHVRAESLHDRFCLFMKIHALHTCPNQSLSSEPFGDNSYEILKKASPLFRYRISTTFFGIDWIALHVPLKFIERARTKSSKITCKK